MSHPFQSISSKEGLHNKQCRSKYKASIIFKQNNWFFSEKWHQSGPKDTCNGHRHACDTSPQADHTQRAHKSVALADCALFVLVIDYYLTITLSFLCSLDNGTQGIAFVNHVFNDLDCAHRLHGAGIGLVYL